MNPKFFRVQIKGQTSTCPWCAAKNDHRTGSVCEHVAKVTVKGVVFFYWGFRPIKEAA